MIYFTSDLHFGHFNVIKYDKRPFNSIEEMDNELITRWNNKVHRDDTIYILGDISWYNDNKTYEIFSKLKGHKILIKGNHDKIRQKAKSCFDEIKDYGEIRVNERIIVMSHYPIHFYNHHYRNAIMLYGHVHNTQEETLTQEIKQELLNKNIPCEMYNVGCMMWNYEPVSLDEILKEKNND